MSGYFAFPSTVRTLAYENGVHNDCVIAGAKGACRPCVHILVNAMIAVYGEEQDLQSIVRAAALDAAAEESMERPS